MNQDPKILKNSKIILKNNKKNDWAQPTKPVEPIMSHMVSV